MWNGQFLCGMVLILNIGGVASVQLHIGCLLGLSDHWWYSYTRLFPLMWNNIFEEISNRTDILKGYQLVLDCKDTQVSILSIVLDGACNWFYHRIGSCFPSCLVFVYLSDILIFESPRLLIRNTKIPCSIRLVGIIVVYIWFSEAFMKRVTLYTELLCSTCTWSRDYSLPSALKMYLQ